MLIAWLLILCGLTAFSAERDPWMPDPSLTPGEIEAAFTSKDATAKGGTQQFRLVTDAMKKRIAAAYGLQFEKIRDRVEFDHLIPNALGGASTEKNLWPEPYRGPWNAHCKDRLEWFAIREVKTGRMSLAEGRALFTDPHGWTNSLLRVFGPRAFDDAAKGKIGDWEHELRHPRPETR
jgi:hypothetical protein